MSDSQHFDVVIIGAGIAGSALALALAGNGLDIAVVEARPLEMPDLPEERSIGDFDSRVSALTPRSQALLESMGSWSAISRYRCAAYQHMTVWDAEGTGHIQFDSAEVAAPALGYIVENRVIVHALLERVTAQKDVTVFDGVGLASCERDEDSIVHVVLDDGEELHTELLVAADGAMSRVRDLMEFPTREWDYGHQGIVATVAFERSHEDTAWQRFLPTGPLALLPLPSSESQHFCSIVWSAQEELAEELMGLEDEEFCSELERASESRLGKVLGVSRRGAFPLRQRHAIDYVQPAVALVGDAAHTIHPLAGQGINLGLQDVAALADEILKGQEKGVSPGQLALLKRYQRRRKGENLLMMGAMDGFKRLFEEPALPVRWLRNVGLRGVNQMAPVKHQLMRHAMGIG
jgi:2-polyprenylphenol 6-hydroxylase